MLALALASAIASCQTGATPDPTPPTVAPDHGVASAPGETPLQPDDPNDPLLVGYCTAQDRVITLEGQVLSGDLPLEPSLAKMREAQRAARVAEEMFRRSGEQRLALLAFRWARSFDEVRARLARGERPFDALRPAIAALGNIEKVFTCELDG